MKFNIFSALLSAIAICASATAFASSTEDPKPIEFGLIPQKMASNGDVWRVSVEADYVVSPGKTAQLKVMEFDVRSGECVTGLKKTVQMLGEDAKVRQQVCVGEVDKKNVVSAWVVGGQLKEQPLLSNDRASLEYGERVYFRFDGPSLESEFSVYRLTAKKL